MVQRFMLSKTFNASKGNVAQRANVGGVSNVSFFMLFKVTRVATSVWTYIAVVNSFRMCCFHM